MTDFRQAVRRADEAIDAAERGLPRRGELVQEGPRAYVGHALEQTSEELALLEHEHALRQNIEDLCQALYNIDDEMLLRMGPAERKLVENTRALLAEYDASRSPADPSPSKVR